MGLEKEILSLIFPKELLAHFEIVLAHEHGYIQSKISFYRNSIYKKEQTYSLR